MNERTSEQQIGIFLFDLPDPTSSKRRYTDIKEITVRRTSAGKFDAATQALFDKLIAHLQHPMNGAHVQRGSK